MNKNGVSKVMLQGMSGIMLCCARLTLVTELYQLIDMPRLISIVTGWFLFIINTKWHGSFKGDLFAFFVFVILYLIKLLLRLSLSPGPLGREALSNRLFLMS